MEPKGKEKELLEREKGFNLYLGGANRERASGVMTAKTPKKRATTPSKRAPPTPSQTSTSKEVTSARNAHSPISSTTQNINPSLKFQQRRRAWKRVCHFLCFGDVYHLH